MNIGIDARAAAEEPAGGGRYVRELLRTLTELDTPHHFVLYARRPWQPERFDKRFSWRVIPAKDPLWHLQAAIRASRACDAFLSTNSYLTAWALTVPAVIVVFDMIAFNRSFRPQRRASVIERLTLPPAVRRAAAIVTISNATRSDLVARYPSAARKTTVAHLAANAAFSPERGGDAAVLARHGIEQPYVLATSTLEPRKNLARLVEAFASLPADLTGARRLVLIGARGWEADETLAAISAHRDRVTALGYVSDGHLPALYRNAELFCYPSLYEGFGLPILEAMQCGTAVIGSNRPSVVEVGGDAVRYIDPLNVGELRAAIQELLVDRERREELVARGLKRAKGFSWRETAQRTLGVLERAAG